MAMQIQMELRMLRTQIGYHKISLQPAGQVQAVTMQYTTTVLEKTNFYKHNLVVPQTKLCDRFVYIPLKQG